MTALRSFFLLITVISGSTAHPGWAEPNSKPRADVRKVKNPITYESYFTEGGCRFRWQDLYGSGFGGDLLRASTLGGAALGMTSCRHSDFMNDPKEAGATFDPTTNRWEPFFYEEDAEALGPVTKIYPLRAINSSGFALNQDQINGEEEKRDRSLHFCLIRPPRALCGGGWVARLIDGPKGDMTQMMLEMLSKIEFIEKPGDALPEPPPPPPPPIVIPCPVEERNEQGFCKSKEWSRSDLR